jgi:ribonuclease J
VNSRTMLSITCYGGVNEIGGNKIVLRDGDSCFSFDFGTSFKRRYEFFEEYLKPRPGVGLLDMLHMELIPPLEGIYRRDLVPTPEFWERWRGHGLYKRMALDGVLLSHAHLDHSGYISFLDPEIAIYCTAMTAFVSKAVQDTGQADFETEVCYANLRKPVDGLLKSAGVGKQRPFVFVDGMPAGEAASEFWSAIPAKSKAFEPAAMPSSRPNVASLPVRHFPVDHSIFGACAYAVLTSQGWIAYSGDLRLHGAAREHTRLWMKEMRELRPLALICEGTRADDDKRVTEEEVRENALREVERSERLVVADFGPRNVERLLTFLAVARQTGRKLLILPKDAYLLEAMHLASPGQVPDVANSADILVYEDPKIAPRPWESELLSRYGSRVARAEDVQRQQDECILCFSFWDVNDLIDIEPRGGTYIYSSSEAHSEEQRLDLERLGNWLQHLDMRFAGDPNGGDEGLHSSGHASGPDLLEVVRVINPRVLITVHTERPDYFVDNLRGQAIDVRVPRVGEEIFLP